MKIQKEAKEEKSEIKVPCVVIISETVQMNFK